MNAMGMSIPAALGVKAADPKRPVIAVVGDGSFRMCAHLLRDAVRGHVGLVATVFNDGALHEIQEAQKPLLVDAPVTTLPSVKLDSVAKAYGTEYLRIRTNDDITSTLERARELAAQNRVVIVDVAIDYSRKSSYTAGVARGVLKGMGRHMVPLVVRAAHRHVRGALESVFGRRRSV
jgi:acetolactate synthase-1/2/3 large subunit